MQIRSLQLQVTVIFVSLLQVENLQMKMFGQRKEGKGGCIYGMICYKLGVMKMNKF